MRLLLLEVCGMMLSIECVVADCVDLRPYGSIHLVRAPQGRQPLLLHLLRLLLLGRKRCRPWRQLLLLAGHCRRAATCGALRLVQCVVIGELRAGR